MSHVPRTIVDPLFQWCTVGSSGGGLELPSDLLLKVKFGGLQRMEAEAREQDSQFAAAEAGVALANRAGRSTKVGDVTRRWAMAWRREVDV